MSTTPPTATPKIKTTKRSVIPLLLGILLYFAAELVINYVLYRSMTISSSVLESHLLEFWVRIVGALGLALFSGPIFIAYFSEHKLRGLGGFTLFRIIARCLHLVILFCLGFLVYHLGYVMGMEKSLRIPDFSNVFVRWATMPLVLFILAWRLGRNPNYFEKIRHYLYRPGIIFLCCVPISFFVQETIVNKVVEKATPADLKTAPLVVSVAAMKAPVFNLALPVQYDHMRPSGDKHTVPVVYYNPDLSNPPAFEKFLLPWFLYQGNTEKYGRISEQDSVKRKILLPLFFTINHYRIHSQDYYADSPSGSRYIGKANSNLMVARMVQVHEKAAALYTQQSDVCAKQLGLAKNSTTKGMFYSYELLRAGVSQNEKQELIEQVTKHHACLFSNDELKNVITPPNVVVETITRTYFKYQDGTRQLREHIGTRKEAGARNAWRERMDAEFGFKTSMGSNLTYEQFFSHPDVKKYANAEIKNYRDNKLNYGEQMNEEAKLLMEAGLFFPTLDNHKKIMQKNFAEFVLQTKLTGQDGYEHLPNTQKQAYKAIMLPFVGMVISVGLIFLNILNMTQLLAQKIRPSLKSTHMFLIKCVVVGLFLIIPLLFGTYESGSMIIKIVYFYQNILVVLYQYVP